jgi:NAD(P)-dependent dehydrogenase (short-subunit alcohol dehydrogenase family)
MRGLKGKVAVIAGGASGIGAATALRLAEEGVTVVIGDINLKGAQDIAAQITAAGGTTTAVQFDVTDDASVRNLVETAIGAYGGIDLMHANVADLSLALTDTDAVDVSLDLFDRTIAVNLRGQLLCTRHAILALLKRGGGAIVYTSSGVAYIGEPERVSYAVSKSGVNALMRHVASRWGKEGIRSNAIAPGLVMTKASLENLTEEAQAQMMQLGRSPRLGRPADVAAMVALLMSDDGEWINGQVLSVDGGFTMR